MTLSNAWTCERCGKMEQGRFTRIQDALEGIAEVKAPHGWERVCGCDLCNDCARELHEWLRPESWIPKVVL